MLKLITCYLKRNSLEKPIDYIIFVTNRCNSRCRHCFNWKNLNQKTNNELTYLELKRFSQEIGKIRSLGISGGEPFLRKDLAKIIVLFAKNNHPDEIEIPTNCLLTDKIVPSIKSFLEKNLPVDYTITLSLDGLEKTHDYIRGVRGNFDRVIKTYKALLPLRRKYGLRIKISTTLNKRNINEIKKLGLYVKENMPEISFHNFEIMRGLPKDPTLKPPSIRDLLRVRPVIFKIWDGYQFYDNPIKSLVAYKLKKYIYNTYLEILKKKRQVVPCLAYVFDTVLDAYGNIYLCELTPKIGNIREKSFKAILKSDRAKKQRLSIRRGDCYCTHSCFMQKSIFLNPKHYFSHGK